MSRKSKYRSTWPNRVRKMAEAGCIEQDMAAELGVHYSTFSQYKKRYPELEEAIIEGTRVANKAVESSLYRRALGYEYEEVTTEVYEDDNGKKRKHVKKTTKRVVEDTKACELWLMNKDPENWRRRKDVNHTGSIDSVIRRGPPVLSFEDMEPEAEPELSDYINNKEDGEKNDG